MEKNSITFADVLDSLNRIDGMMNDLLLNLENWNDIDNKGRVIDFLIDDFERNINGDDSINVYGLNDVVKFIVNEQSKALATKLYIIGEKNTKADELIKSFPEFWNPSFQFLGTLSKLSFDIYNVSVNIEFVKEGIGIQETGDNYPTIPPKVRDLFPSEEQCETFVRTNYGKSHKIIANNYLEEKGVVHPDSPKYVAVKTTLYNYFILPFKPKDGEERNNIYCDPSTFFKHFKY
jgi:hypothetical protein